MGRWTHELRLAFLDEPLGRVEFGPRAVSGVALSMPLLLDWFDRWITGADAGAAGGVRYWQLGEDEWREAETWPPPSSEQRWHLGSGGGANTRDGDGTLSGARRRATIRPTPTATTRSTRLPRSAARR